MKTNDPDYLNTVILPVSLDPESKKRCERFEKYLLETVQTAGPIAQVQEFGGYCFVRHTKYAKCLVLIGPGADGKSTLLNILRAVVGAENCSAVSFPSLENEFHRSSLYHKVLNISTEIGQATMESPYFKAITAGDPINGAFKTKDVFEFRPYCKLAFAGPSLPRVRDNSYGFFRRFLPVQFKRQFKENDSATDPDLLDKLMEELPEIFYFFLCGLKRLTDQKRFTHCDETETLLMGYRRSNNPVLCFVEDECTLNVNDDVAKDTLYESYRDYCKKYGYMALNKDNFFRELYTAISNLQLYRPSVNGVREYRVKGITLGVDITPVEENK
jgi:putative DNA primase/helicase